MTSDARRDASRLADLLRSEHHARADFLLALADFDRRRGWAALGHASLWAFLHHDLGLSAGAAFQRKAAADLLQRIPEVEEPLRDGRLCLSSVAHLAKVLTPENQADRLPRFFGLSSREARALAAELEPVAVVPTRVVITAAGAKVAPRGMTGSGASAALHTYETGITQPGRESPTPTSPSTGTQVEPPSPLRGEGRGEGHRELPAPTGFHLEADPLTAELHRLHLTVSRRFLQKVEALRAARSHANPGASVEALLEEAMDQLLERETKRRVASTVRPQVAARPAAPETITAQVRREVWGRDEGRCQWPLEAGGICGSTWQLELDHATPKARGGPTTAANLRLLCRAHNAEAARRAFGPDFMVRAIRQAGAARMEPDRGAGSPPA